MLFALLVGAVLPALAQEPVLARVLSLEPDAGILLVRVEGEPPREIRVRIDNEAPIGALEPGSLLRLWPGDALVAGQSPVSARVERVTGGRFGRDLTGVRSRLSRGAAGGFGGRGGHGRR